MYDEKKGGARRVGHPDLPEASLGATGGRRWWGAGRWAGYFVVALRRYWEGETP